MTEDEIVDLEAIVAILIISSLRKEKIKQLKRENFKQLKHEKNVLKKNNNI